MAKFTSAGFSRGIRTAGSAIAEAIREDNELERRSIAKIKAQRFDNVKLGISRGAIKSPEEVSILLKPHGFTDVEIKGLQIEVEALTGGIAARQEAQKVFSDLLGLQTLEMQDLPLSQRQEATQQGALTEQERRIELLSTGTELDLTPGQTKTSLEFARGITSSDELLDKIMKIRALNIFADENPNVKEALKKEPSLKGLIFDLEPKPKKIDPATDRRLEQTRRAQEKFITAGLKSINKFKESERFLLAETDNPDLKELTNSMIIRLTTAAGRISEEASSPIQKTQYNKLVKEITDFIKSTIEVKPRELSPLLKAAQKRIKQKRAGKIRRRATNPTTGEIVEWDGKKWVRVN